LTGRKVEKLHETLSEMKRLGIGTDNCHILPANLCSYEEIMLACEKVKNSCNGLNGLVNSAALPSKPGSDYPLLEDDTEYWDNIIATNLTAPWYLTRTIFPFMMASGSVRVVFMTSEAGWAATSGFGMYNVSKAGLNSLGQSLAEECHTRYRNGDIQMNVVSPGEAKTEMNQGSTVSPYSVVSIMLLLLSHPEGGPNGKFFHRDGRHLEFCYTKEHERSLV
jgi:3-oxoacyl-[acyl-carrier protein] reductase